VGALVIFALAIRRRVSGAAACLTASILYGVLFVYASRFLAGRGSDPIVLSTGQLSVATVLSACALPIGWQIPELRIDALGGVVVLGVLGTGLAYILNYQLITASPPALALRSSPSPTWRHIGDSAGLRTPIWLHVGVRNIRVLTRIVLRVPTELGYPRGAYMMMATPSRQVAAPR
jgi:hypothetical protein